LNILLWSLAIFFGRIIDVTLGTIRINFIVRKRKIFAAAIGFIEVTIFVAVIARVIEDLNNNFYGIFAYGAGFAVGTLIGITISEKLSQDLISNNIISKARSDEIVNLLRQEGFGATCYNGYGKDGDVQIINVVCRQSHIPKLNKLIYEVDPDIFITSHLLGSQRGGFMYGMKKK
jgi:uncharacterized protein YebE (UPF0316 family)